MISDNSARSWQENQGVKTKFRKNIVYARLRSHPYNSLCQLSPSKMFICVVCFCAALSPVMALSTKNGREFPLCYGQRSAMCPIRSVSNALEAHKIVSGAILSLMKIACFVLLLAIKHGQRMSFPMI